MLQIINSANNYGSTLSGFWHCTCCHRYYRRLVLWRIFCSWHMVWNLCRLTISNDLNLNNCDFLSLHQYFLKLGQITFLTQCGADKQHWSDASPIWLKNLIFYHWVCLPMYPMHMGSHYTYPCTQCTWVVIMPIHVHDNLRNKAKICLNTQTSSHQKIYLVTCYNKLQF